MLYQFRTSSSLYKSRLYHSDHLSENEEIDLSPAAIHYLINVMRYQVGDKLAVFNDQDGEWLAEIIMINKKKVICQIQQHLRQPLSLTEANLLFAPLKPHRQAFLMEKATELGVATLQPIISQYSQIRTFNRDKALNQVIEAVEQCERLTIPLIDNIMPLSQKLDRWYKDCKDQPLLIGAVRETGPLLPKVLATFQTNQLSFLIGPEGGFSEQEMQTFKQYPFVHFFSLGQNILRAETAALACLSHMI